MTTEGKRLEGFEVREVESGGDMREDLVAAVGRLEAGRPLVVELMDPIGGGPPPTEVRATWQRTFGAVPVGEPLLYEDSSGTISLSDNQGDIATRLGLVVDPPARIRSA